MGSTASPSSGPRPAQPEERLRQLLEETLSVLSKERSLTESLLKQAQEVQRHLVADDYTMLLESAQGQETFSQQLAQWEHKRLLLTRQLAGYFPMFARLRLSQWANYLPEPYGSRFHVVQVALKNATTTLQTVNRQNMALVQRSLRFADMALGIETSVYGAPRGRVNRDVDSPQLFDRTL